MKRGFPATKDFPGKMAGQLTLATGSTSSGYTEAAARFTNGSVTLNAAGQYIEV